MKAYVGLGANLGDARRTLLAALHALTRMPATRLVGYSSLYRSAPIDASGPDYWNAVAALDTQLAPRRLLTALLRIERRHQRERPYRNAPRTLDLDLLLYGSMRTVTPRLSLPHPRMADRAFVLAPLLEIDPATHIPGKGPARRYRSRVSSQRIQRIEKP
jgi:2-amino-4-hydroxy-6-hydroxymethyldihydropteridine diphosphokinase